MPPVPPCHPGPFLVGSVHPGARGPMPAGPEPCRCAQVSLLPHGCAAPAWGAQQCHLALPYLIHHPSVGSSPIPGELHPSGCLPPACASQRTCTCHASTRDPPRLLPAVPAGAEPCGCAQVSWYPCGCSPAPWSTWNSSCCSSGASCSPVLLLTPGISSGIRLVRLGWIQVLQTHLVLPALPWSGVHGKPTCAPDLPEALGSVLG